MTRSFWLGMGFVCAAALSTSVAHAGPKPEKSLEKCQKTVAKEVAKYTTARQKAVAKCLDKIAKERIASARDSSARAAKPCSKTLGKLENSVEPLKALQAKARGKISKACDPGFNLKLVHSVADILGVGASVAGDAIAAQSLSSFCASFGGDGAVDTLEEWFACQFDAADCQSNQQIAVTYPLVLDWLADVRGSVLGLGPADPRILDAVAALDDLDSGLGGNGGGGTPAVQCGSSCGNDVLNPAEQCDGTDLGGATCESLGFVIGDLACNANCTFDMSDCSSERSFPATGQASCWNAVGAPCTCGTVGCTGQDGDIQAGAARNFILDDANGVIYDLATGLTWEAKDDNNAGGGALHDVDTVYTWAQAFDTHIAQLNGRCDGSPATPCTTDANCIGFGSERCGHAGHQDWRVPNLHELMSILDLNKSFVAAPTIYGEFNQNCSAGCSLAFCSCTGSATYWSSSTFASTPFQAWTVSFFSGSGATSEKSNTFRVRAVRGGL